MSDKPRSTTDLIDRAKSEGEYSEIEAQTFKTIWNRVKQIPNMESIFKENLIRTDLSKAFGPYRAKEMISILQRRTAEVLRVSGHPRAAGANRPTGVLNPESGPPSYIQNPPRSICSNELVVNFKRPSTNSSTPSLSKRSTPHDNYNNSTTNSDNTNINNANINNNSQSSTSSPIVTSIRTEFPSILIHISTNRCDINSTTNTNQKSCKIPNKDQLSSDVILKENENESIACIICLERKKCCLARPCKHLILCIQCSINVGQKDHHPKCPLCQNLVEEFEFIYT